MALARRSSRSSGSSTRPEADRAKARRYALCLSDSGYPESLTPRKVYEVLSDAAAEREQMLRVVDETGDDYLYPAEGFALIELPKSVEKALKRAS
jgi:hypothetical protein